MSSESIDRQWDECIQELQQLVQIEQSIDESKPVSITNAHAHFAKLYVRYSIVLNNLNKCYEFTVQPQKRSDIKSTLLHVICRVVNLRHLIVKWAPPNPDVLTKDGPQQPFPWEYIDLGPTLKEVNAVPTHLDVKTPSFFKEEAYEKSRERNALVLELLREKYGDTLPSLEEKTWSVQSLSDADKENAVAVVSADRDNEACNHSASSESESDTEDSEHFSFEDKQELAATKIQASLRGLIGKKKANELREWLDVFIGMKTGYNRQERHHLTKNLEDINRKRKQEQSYCQEKYDQDLTKLKDVVRDEEGFRMEVDLREERIKWITDHVVSQNAIPDSFEGFYSKDEPPPLVDKEVVKDAKSKDAKKDDKNDSKGKDKAAPIEVELPSISAPPKILNSLAECIDIYSSRWQHRNIGPDRIASQYHDEELAKDLIIRDQVKSELTKGVEEKLLSNLLKIKAAEDADKKKSKSKKDSKGKKGKSKKSGGKGKKEKPLPGAKLPGMKEMAVDEMLRELINHGLVCIPAQHAINDLIGGFESQPPRVAVKADNERWIPRDPSAFHLKRSIYDYCILPLGHRDVKSNLQDTEHVRSLLFYGPEGSGKTLMAQTIASELGALFINLSSSTIGNSFGGKEGATKLVHMVFTVAKEKSFGPVVIYLDDCHEFFMGKVKKGVSVNIKADLKRFQKDLLVYKNQALINDDRVLVIGCTNRPDLADVKLLRWKGPKGKPEKQGFFERPLYFPRVNHPDRTLIWKHYIQTKIAASNLHQNMAELDYGALSTLSDGFSAAAIASIVENTLTENRLMNLTSDALSEHDFSCQLSQKKPDDEVFLNFTRQITELDARWKALKGPPKAAAKKK